RDGLLPPIFSRVHPPSRAALPALLLTGICMVAVAAGGSIALSAAVGGFLYVLHYVLPLVGLIRVRMRGDPRPAFVTPAVCLILPLAFGGCGLLLCARGAAGAIGGVTWILLGLTLWGTRWIVTRYRTTAVVRPTASATATSVVNAAPSSWASAK